MGEDEFASAEDDILQWIKKLHFSSPYDKMKQDLAIRVLSEHVQYDNPEDYEE